MSEILSLLQDVLIPNLADITCLYLYDEWINENYTTMKSTPKYRHWFEPDVLLLARLSRLLTMEDRLDPEDGCFVAQDIDISLSDGLLFAIELMCEKKLFLPAICLIVQHEYVLDCQDKIYIYGIAAHMCDSDSLIWLKFMINRYYVDANVRLFDINTLVGIVMRAATNRETKVVQYIAQILDNKLDIYAYEYDGYIIAYDDKTTNIIESACRGGNLELVQWLLDNYLHRSISYNNDRKSRYEYNYEDISGLLAVLESDNVELAQYWLARFPNSADIFASHLPDTLIDRDKWIHVKWIVEYIYKGLVPTMVTPDRFIYTAFKYACTLNAVNIAKGLRAEYGAALARIRTSDLYEEAMGQGGQSHT